MAIQATSILAAFVADGRWRAAGHDALYEWFATIQSIAPWLFVALLALLVARGIQLRHRYRAVEALDLAAVERLRGQVAEAEARTVGEIGVVVLERSDRHPAAPWIGAVVFTALASFATVHLLVALPLPAVVLVQLVFGFGMHRLVRASRDLQRRFVSNQRAAEMAEEQAIQEFHSLGLRETVARTGVLLFVSLLERQVVVLADEGIASEVEPDVWVEVDAAILAGAKRGALEDGLARGVSLVGSILADRFPAPSGGENQVLDHVIVRRE